VLEELRRFQEKIGRSSDNEGKGWGVRYVILASVTPGVFNFGGDLRLFIRCLKENDPETLHRYAKECIDVLYAHSVGFHLPVTTISLVQGDALGGGFEAALASDILVAEKQSQFGFPEVLFNLFPGMGAYNLLQRRIGMQKTERMLLNGKLLRAEDLHAGGSSIFWPRTAAGRTRSTSISSGRRASKTPGRPFCRSGGSSGRSATKISWK
jgi:DSF synthase